ncbi:MAG: glycoside hydrolase family 3 C-terminal domain-containing protein [Firmicutes bacterium]|nr:glycoside hydrolase family 3 C-terminal domain-containing protein [Lachnospiraceae bacterium]MBQ7060131.1 glycoside hydrolase family 3 C-terminal domain-containing protein [Bacillota bacterium]
MDPNELFAGLSRGKSDVPLLLPTDDLIFDPMQIDGKYEDLSAEASGCVVLMFTKEMDPSVSGEAFLEGERLPKCVLRQMPQMGGLWVVGISLRGIITECGRSYTLRVEGFRDADGLVMNPQEFTVKTPPEAMPDKAQEARDGIALQAARESIVLLENNGVLPLKHGAVLNLFGKGIYRFRITAAGAGEINPRRRISLLQGLAENGNFRINHELADYYRHDEDSIPSDELLARAREFSDTALVLIERSARENKDNHSGPGGFLLTEQEEALLKTVRDSFEKLIVILNTGHPMDVIWAKGLPVDALIWNGYGGMFASQALAEVLSGQVNPSGKLPDTWAKRYEDIPSSRNFYDSFGKEALSGDAPLYLDTVYEEGLYVGYRYFSTFGKEPAYSFGYGLSFTQFAVRAEKPVWADGKLSLKLTVENTGAAAGREVLQIYVKKPESLGETPERELVWFSKSRLLASEESENFHAEIAPELLAVYDTVRPGWVIPEGSFTVYAGNSVEAPVVGSFSAKEQLLRRTEHLMTAPEPPKELTKQDTDSFPKGERSGIKKEESFLPKGERRRYPVSWKPVSTDKEVLTFEDLKEDPSLDEAFVNQLSIKDLVRLLVCDGSGWNPAGIGEAGGVARLPGRGMPLYRVADGNSGVKVWHPNIGLPSGASLAASFNEELLEEVGRAIGEEAKEQGIPLILAPAINLHRNPLCGRQAEYFSEDPYLAGCLAGVYCRGMESAGTGSCLKHMIANNCESARKRNQSIIGERTLRELYLRPFEIAMRIHRPASVMTSYNAVNGCSTASDPELIQGFLRAECGFEGVVMTDWDSYQTADPIAAAEAGNGWLTPGFADDAFIQGAAQEALEAGLLHEDRLRDSALRLIRLMLRFPVEGEKHDAV